MGKCVICGAETRIVEDKNHQQYAWCDQCGFVGKDPSLWPDPQKEEARYLQHQNSYFDDDYLEYLRNFVTEAILPYHKGKTLLDFGSGPTPVLADVLRKDFFFTVDTFDKFFTATWDYQTKRYHVITAVEVMEHIGDPLPQLRVFHDLLEPKGIIAIMTLFAPDENSFADWWYHRDITHISFYRLKTWEYIAQTLGFTIVYQDGKHIVVLEKQ